MADDDDVSKIDSYEVSHQLMFIAFLHISSRKMYFLK